MVVQYRGDEDYLIEWALRQNLRGKSYWQHIELSLEQLEQLYSEVYARVRDDRETQEIVSICESFINRAKLLKKQLDEAIVQPLLV